MNKKGFIEQLKRAEVSREEELREIDSYHNDSYHIDAYWKTHLDGHKIINDELLVFCQCKYVGKKELFSYMKKRKQEEKLKIKELDKKYHQFKFYKDMSEQDEYTYGLADGIECHLNYLLDVLKGKKYYSKKYKRD